jgi:hypothetical protein
MKTIKMILGVVMWLLCAPVLLIIMGAIGLIGSPYGLLRSDTVKQHKEHKLVPRPRLAESTAK